MRSRDREDCAAGACRDSLLDLVFAGQVPNERHVEMLLDRFEREEPRPAVPTREPRP